jgi:hypothetical protein
MAFMIIFDVEASGLSNQNYPIEIVWQYRYVASHFDSFLINTLETWMYREKYSETGSQRK